MEHNVTDQQLRRMDDGREYRSMVMTIRALDDSQDMVVEGYATTFDDPYVLYEYDGIQYKEVIDRHALDGADLSDVIMQYDHNGRVFARTGRSNTLLIEPQPLGLSSRRICLKPSRPDPCTRISPPGL